MKINCLTMNQVQDILKEKFPFYSKYVNWLDNDFEDTENQDFTQTAFNLACLPNRNLSVLEKINYLQDSEKNLVNELLKNNNLDTGHFLIIHEYKQFPWVLQSFKDNEIVNKSISTMQHYTNNTYEQIVESYGFECFGKISELITELFYFPFFMNYRDINILFFDKEYLIKIDHHLCFSIIHSRLKD